MQIIKYATILIISATLPLASCKKGDDSSPGKDYGQGTGHCRLTLLHSNQSGQAKPDAMIAYDAEDRIATYKFTNTVSGVSSIITQTFAYHSNYIIITGTYPSGQPYSRDSITIDSAGRLQAAFFNPVGSASRHDIYHYDTQGLLSSTEESVGGAAFAVNHRYTWALGNVATDSSDLGMYHYTYYPDKLSQASAQDQMASFLISGGNYKRGVHLLKSITINNIAVNFTEEHTYAFDGEGKILADTAAGPGYRNYSGFEYECK